MSAPNASAERALSEALARGNPVVFMDVAIEGVPQGRIRMELFSKECPRTVENFRQLCTGEMRKKEQPVGYKNSTFHRVIRGFMLQAGDFVNGDGTGKQCIYGTQFDDENLTLKHQGPGYLSMANSGPNTNGCQFFITCEKCEWLDSKHVVFGKVLDDDGQSMLTVRKIENMSVSTDGRHAPKLKCTISECGEL